MKKLYHKRWHVSGTSTDLIYVQSSSKIYLNSKKQLMGRRPLYFSPEQEHQTKDGTSLEFLLEMLSTLKQEKGGAAVVNVIKKAGLESRMMEFFPANNQQQTDENLARTFAARDLSEVVSLGRAQAGKNAKKELQAAVMEAIEEEKPSKEIAAEVQEAVAKSGGTIAEHDAVVMVSRGGIVVSRVSLQNDEGLELEVLSQCR